MTSNGTPLEAALADYLRAMDAGRPLEREAFLAAHPDVAEELREYFADVDAISSFVRPDPVVRKGSDTPPTGLPKRFGEYQIEGVLGRGGNGIVYRAFHDRLGRSVALKVLVPNIAADPEAIARFHREMLASGQLEHPHIVKTYDAGSVGEVSYLAMEYLEGLDLSKLVALPERRTLSVPDACEAVRQAAMALQHVHDKELVHRDVKPGNLFLTSDGTIKLLDLGLVRLCWAAPGELTIHQIVGTFEYMAPEQRRQSQSVGPIADVYALGATLYRLLTGSPPVAAGVYENIVQKIHAAATDQIRDIREIRPEIPQRLAQLVMKLLDKDPDRRPNSANGIAETLALYAKGADLERLTREARTTSEPMAAASNSSGTGRMLDAGNAAPTQTVPSRTGRFAMWGAIAAAVVLAVFLFLNRHRKPDAERAIESNPLRSLEDAEDIPGVFPVAGTLPDGRRWQVQTVGLIHPPKCIDWHPSGEQLVCGTANGQLRVYHVASRCLKRILDSPTREEVLAVDWSPDGQHLAAVLGNKLHVWAEDGKLLWIRRADSIRGVSWAPDSRRIVVGGDSMALYSLEGERFPLPLPSFEFVEQVEWSPGGEWISGIAYRNSAPTENGRNPQPRLLVFPIQKRGRKLLDLSLGEIRAATWKPDGTRFAVQSRDALWVVLPDTGIADKIGVWDHPNEGAALTWSVNGDLDVRVVRGEGPSIQFVENPERTSSHGVAQVRTHVASHRHPGDEPLKWSPTGHVLGEVTPDMIQLEWGKRALGKLGHMGSRDQPWGWSPCGRWLSTIPHDTPAAPKASLLLFGPNGVLEHSLSVSGSPHHAYHDWRPDGKAIATVTDTSFDLWHWTEDALGFRRQRMPISSRAPGRRWRGWPMRRTAVAWHPRDSNKLAVVDAHGTIRIVDATGRVSGSIDSGSVASLQWSPSGQYLNVILNGDLPNHLPKSEPKDLLDMVVPTRYSPIQWSPDEQVYSIDTNSFHRNAAPFLRASKRFCSEAQGGQRVCSWSPTEPSVAYSNGKEVRVRNTQTNEEQVVVDKPARSLAWNSDGTLLAFGPESGGVRIFDVHRHQSLGFFPTVTPPERLFWRPEANQLVAVLEKGVVCSWRSAVTGNKRFSLHWVIVPSVSGDFSIVHRSGQLIHGDPKTAESDLVYLVREHDGRLDVLSAPEFQQLIPSPPR